ncbi:putative DNA helicase ino80 [Ascosphaera acerosa]|nr:putative DNA helicase ino80 [Ascosphaera acerosa]
MSDPYDEDDLNLLDITIPIQHHLTTADLIQLNLRDKGLEQEFFTFIQQRKRKAEETDALEHRKRVKRREACLSRLCAILDKQVQAGAQRFGRSHEHEVILDIQAKEVHDEKERKKEMQRKRRRENAMRLETQKLYDAQRRLSKEEDETEKEKLLKEVEKSRRRIQVTQRAIDRSNEPDEEASEATRLGTKPATGRDGPASTRSRARVSTPAAPTASGATGPMSKDDEELEQASKSVSRGKRATGAGERTGPRAGVRLRKSKEKSQAGKEATESAHAALDQNGGTPSEQHKTKGQAISKRELKKDGRAAKAKEKERERKAKEQEKERGRERERDKEKGKAPGITEDLKSQVKLPHAEVEGKDEISSPQPIAPPVSTLDSKGYNQIYEQIWRDIARKDIPKVFRIKTTSLNTRQDNLRKTAQLASKQCKKWQDRTNKWHKDTQSRAKRTMREMMSFWKRNEREERDLRRLAEKQELASAKKAEADREANRQRRKLNFLISQTEIYSHFIGKKVKTAEVEAEHSGGGIEPATEVDRAAVAQEATEQIALPSTKVTTQITNLDDVDFDAVDDATLRQAAVANAQSAYATAQRNARAFDKEPN